MLNENAVRFQLRHCLYGLGYQGHPTPENFIASVYGTVYMDKFCPLLKGYTLFCKQSDPTASTARVTLLPETSLKLSI